jgi:cysteinyl-tRNA synthetase
MVGPVIFDAVKRYLTYLGYRVTWVVNITDVDDKLITRARELGTTVKDLAERMTVDYLECLKKLNVASIDAMPKATEHIPGMIAMIDGLIAKGYAYPAGGDVYFDIAKDNDYGKLCNRDPEQLEAGARIEVSDRKRNPGDFALWKSAKPGEPAWDSPWGPGRPGWHIECSVMSMKYLGETLDIHGGGLDLQFPHHENELAQSESYTGKPFATVWMHNGLLKMGQAKMAGSIGNVVNVADLLAKHHPETVRFLLLATHYRSPIEYSDNQLQATKDALETFKRFFERVKRILGGDFETMFAATKRDRQINWQTPSKRFAAVFSPNEQINVAVPALREKFFEFMDDDFNTGGAVGVLFSLVNYLNRFTDIAGLESFAGGEIADKKNLQEAVFILRELATILGLFWEPPQQPKLGGDDQLVSGLMQLLLDVRHNLRALAKGIPGKDDPTKKGLFDQTDQIRKRLGELNVMLEDRPGGKTDWRLG